MVKLPSYSSAPPLVSLPSLLVLSFVVLLTVSLLPLSGDSPIPICVVLLVSPSLALRMQLVWQHFERQMQLRERRRSSWYQRGRIRGDLRLMTPPRMKSGPSRDCRGRGSGIAVE